MAELADLWAFAARQHRQVHQWTLTLAPEDLNTRRQKMANLKRGLARRGHTPEFAWATEKGSETGMTHVHAFVHSAKVPEPLLGEIWGAVVHSDPVRRGDERRASGYPLKGGFIDLQSHLDLNGGKGATWTQHFLGADLRTTRAAYRVEQGKDRLDWHVEASRPDTALGDRP